LWLFFGTTPCWEGVSEGAELHASINDDTAARSGPAGTEPDTITITVQEAIMMALANNRSLKVERLTPDIKKTLEEEEDALFSPVAKGDISVVQEQGNSQSHPERDDEGGDIEADIGLSRFFPTGTDVEVNLLSKMSWSNLYSDFHQSRIGVSVTQSLLQGKGLDYNLAKIRQARLDTRISKYEVRGFSESLVATVETTYWDYALAQLQIEIYRESLNIAEKQKNEILEMIRFGKLPESELVAAMAEIAMRREGLINALSNVETTKLQLLRLLSPPVKNVWNKNVELSERPVVPVVQLDTVDAHIALALVRRPDISQAQLKIDRGEIEIVRTKNGLLPKMDLFITLGKTGYASSFDNSLSDIDKNSYDAYAGISFQYPLANKSAKALHRHATLSKKQLEEAMENLKQLAEVDIRSAYIEVERAQKQIDATEATYELQKEKLRTEIEKFRFGKSTTLLVAQAQRDLLESRIAQIKAIATYLKSFVELYRLEGSLLERRGISLTE
jgi:outer membrane protein TolC